MNVLSGQTLFDELNSKQKAIRKQHKINKMMKDWLFFAIVNSRDFVRRCLRLLRLFLVSGELRRPFTFTCLLEEGRLSQGVVWLTEVTEAHTHQTEPLLRTEAHTVT